MRGGRKSRDSPRLRPGLAPGLRVMRGRAVYEMAHCAVQPPIARIHAHMHHIPALEQDIADRPFLAIHVAGENETAFARAYPNLDFRVVAHLFASFPHVRVEYRT